jgi:gamma-glutamyltranspeptidase/glutathione hydrolase
MAGSGTSSQLGVIAAGHPLTAQAGADVLREGGNAVDAAVAAILASLVCEPVLTGLGAGGYMLVVEPERDPVLLDFFVEAPGRGSDPAGREELIPITISFGDAVQVFNIGPASVGTYGMPAGVHAAATRFGRMSMAELAAPAMDLARQGVEINAQQGYLLEILADIVTSTPECAAL